MRFVRLGILALLFTSTNLFAMQALQPAVEFDPGFSPELRLQLVRSLNGALQVIQDLATPAEYPNSLFNWTAPRDILNGKSLVFVVTTSKSPVMRELSQLPLEIDDNTDAVTLLYQPEGKNEYQIRCFLLMDRIFFDPNWHARPDGFARLIVTLSREIYGSIQRGLESTAGTDQKSLGKNLEIESSNAAIHFLEQAIRNPRFKTLPPRLQDELQKLLEPERVRLQRLQYEAYKNTI